MRAQLHRVPPRQWPLCPPRQLPLSLFTILFMLGCVLSPGMVHPDELTQSSEPFSCAVSHVDAMVAWEWRDCAAPVRSFAPAAALVGPPLALLQAVRVHLAPRASAAWDVLAPRLWLMALVQVVLHPTVRDLCVHWGVDAAAVGTAVSTSWVVSLLLTRPFTNTAETWALLGLLVGATRILRPTTATAPPRPLWWGGWMGAVLAAGTYARFTFPVFAAPVLVFTAVRLPRAVPFRHLAAAAVAGGVSASLLFFVLDASFFGSPGLPPPLRMLLYNVNPTNLARHGLHPHWLHAVVNLPLLFGPALFALAWVMRTQQLHGLPRLAVSIIACAVAVLSAAPHQEPRFLAPLVLPVCILVGPVLFSDSDSPLPRGPRRLLATTWLAFNVLAATWFGGLHQAGVIPSVVALADGRIAAGHSGQTMFSFMWWTSALAAAPHPNAPLRVDYERTYPAPLSLFRQPPCWAPSTHTSWAPWCGGDGAAHVPPCSDQDRRVVDTSLSSAPPRPDALLVAPFQDPPPAQRRVIAVWWPHISVEDPPRTFDTASLGLYSAAQR